MNLARHSQQSHRHHRSSGRAVGWAVLGGILGAILIGIPMHLMGMMVMGPAALAGSDSVWVGWAVHLLAGALFAAPFGLFIHSARYGAGAWKGALYGLLVGIVFAWLALFAILDMPLFTTMALLDVLMHTMWGLVVGLVTAWGLQRAGGGVHRRRRAARPV